ncbi:glycosyltransferase WbsX family protein [Segatella copri]|jgi:hypothetical protein|uniref:Glycosyl hydrolase n=1 Tax=Segatella copri TaxID=165179 RepID=A0AAW9TEC6_9BACT|nr:glycoside hydrolase family 99-like domain-containing protein [Segatella copri]MQN27649.1 glycosyl hydrolase [Segatella copri]MQN32585.1 glycosyl hydrolase [Segatella copri]MQN38405.1 glycosyl hydrolase [Segatella copri]MQN76036.1 glycosyl hydrolase [Segatella copri]MQO27346.1 glycosyl hydrolase [Segatella copri]
MLKNSKKRVIAIHLPQFYPFKENDEWWGKGFTEWRTVTKAKPRYWNHYQPVLPADLGFYDLRMKEARLAQETMAKQYGIDGFCYYHYWFNGHLIMEKPIEAKLNDKDENFPFMLCWANENWHRNWDGEHNVMLLEQHYSRSDDEQHFKYLLKFFKDPRYIRIDGKPVFAIYKPHLIPDLKDMLNTFRTLAKENGIELYICKFESNGSRGKQLMDSGFDSSIEFQPQNTEGYDKITEFFCKVYKRLFHTTNCGLILNYRKYVNFQIKKPTFKEYKRFPCVCPCWDNSPRRVKNYYFSFKNPLPKYFKKWFSHVYSTFIPYSDEENLIFINAWNEWAEGCHLEPDLKYGTGYLEAIKDVRNYGENKG